MDHVCAALEVSGLIPVVEVSVLWANLAIWDNVSVCMVNYQMVNAPVARILVVN